MLSITDENGAKVLARGLVIASDWNKWLGSDVPDGEKPPARKAAMFVASRLMPPAAYLKNAFGNARASP